MFLRVCYSLTLYQTPTKVVIFCPKFLEQSVHLQNQLLKDTPKNSNETTSKPSKNKKPHQPFGPVSFPSSWSIKHRGTPIGSNTFHCFLKELSETILEGKELNEILRFDLFNLLFLSLYFLGHDELPT